MRLTSGETSARFCGARGIGDPRIAITLLLALMGNNALAAASDLESRPAPANAVSRQAAERAKALGVYSEAIARAAAAWGAPLVTMYCLRYNDALGPHPKAAVNSIWRMEDISTPELSEEAGYVTPNVNTLYGFGFLDLAAEPVILSVPNSHGRYYMVEIVDFWTNAFAYAGGVASGYKGGKFALVGPDWKGKLPPDAKRIDSPTRWVLIRPRSPCPGPRRPAGGQDGARGCEGARAGRGPGKDPGAGAPL